MQRVSLTWSSPQGGPYFSNLYFSGIGAADAATAHARAVALMQVFDQDISNAYSWTVDGDVYDVDTVTGQATAVHPVTPVTATGSSVGQPLPFTTQALAQWFTNVFQAGRQIRGRFFIPGFTEASTQGGSPDPGVFNPLRAALQAWVAANPPSAKLVVWSRTGGTATVVVASGLWDQFAVLRSRRD